MKQRGPEERGSKRGGPENHLMETPVARNPRKAPPRRRNPSRNRFHVAGNADSASNSLFAREIRGRREKSIRRHKEAQRQRRLRRNLAFSNEFGSRFRLCVGRARLRRTIDPPRRHLSASETRSSSSDSTPATASSSRITTNSAAQFTSSQSRGRNHGQGMRNIRRNRGNSIHPHADRLGSSTPASKSNPAPRRRIHITLRVA